MHQAVQQGVGLIGSTAVDLLRRLSSRSPLYKCLYMSKSSAGSTMLPLHILVPPFPPIASCLVLSMHTPVTLTEPLC